MTISGAAALVSITAAYYAGTNSSPQVAYSEHTKGSRPSTKNKREQGQARKQRQEGGDKKRKKSGFEDRSNKRSKKTTGNKYTARIEMLY